MPREPEPTTIRRVLMQSIMWIVLGLTVGAAAAMSHYKQRGLRPTLDEPVQLRGVSAQMPAGWIAPKEKRADSIVRQSPQFGDEVVLTVRQLNPLQALGWSSREPEPEGQNLLQEIDLGGVSAKMMLYRAISREGERVTVLEASRQLPKARVLSIGMIIRGGGGSSELKHSIDLIKRVAASVEIDANY